jgi:hypothetical protein
MCPPWQETDSELSQECKDKVNQHKGAHVRSASLVIVTAIGARRLPDSLALDNVVRRADQGYQRLRAPVA